MVYLDEEHFSRMSPGTPVGDAKNLETRGRPIYVDKNGVPTNGLRSGSVVYIDESGYAVPFTDPKEDFQTKTPFPYGVVWTIDANTDPNVRDITPHKNQAVVVVDGVVPVVLQTGQTKPKTGEQVNPYGGVAADTQLPVLGICDGTGTGTDGTGKSVTLVAVRVKPSVNFTSSGELPNVDVDAKVNSDGIHKNSWLLLDTVQPQATDKDQRPRVVLAANSNAGNKHIYGIALEEPTGDNVRVRVYGTAYVPYVYKDSQKLAALKEANGGELPSTFPNRITYTNGGFGFGITAILGCITAIGAAIDLGERIYRMIRGKSSPAKCVDNVPAKTPKFHALLAEEGGKFDVEPDGYLGVFVNTGLAAQPTLTEAPVLLDPPELDANGNQLITEGRIYAGSQEGVRRITPENQNASSFFGVSALYDIDDEEVNPPTKNGEQRIRVIREGNANVLAKGDWKQGDYINYLGEAIPAEDEEFVPHIGKALEATEDGKLGSVDIRAFNPNTYIVVDYCLDQPLTEKSMVTVIDRSIAAGNTYIPRAELEAAFWRHPHPGPLRGVTGVLVRFDRMFFPESPEHYTARAIIQVGGYVKCKYDWLDSIKSGAGVPHGGFVTHLDSGFVIGEKINPGDQYIDIIGNLLIPSPPREVPGENCVEAWVLINPRTVYITLPLSESEYK